MAESRRFIIDWPAAGGCTIISSAGDILGKIPDDEVLAPDGVTRCLSDCMVGEASSNEVMVIHNEVGAWETLASSLFAISVSAVSFSRSCCGAVPPVVTGENTCTLLDRRGPRGPFVAACFCEGMLIPDSWSVGNDGPATVASALDKCAGVGELDWWGAVTIGLTPDAASCVDAVVAACRNHEKNGDNVKVSDKSPRDAISVMCSLRTSNDWQTWLSKSEWQAEGVSALRAKLFWIP
jgi:hypothetical protein